MVKASWPIAVPLGQKNAKRELTAYLVLIFTLVYRPLFPLPFQKLHLEAYFRGPIRLN